MTKKQTVRLYTDSGIYKGWTYLNRNSFADHLVSWIRSGNYLRFNVDGYNYNINWINKDIFVINQYLYNLIK